MKYVWELINVDDELELPILIADTADELGRLIGGVSGRSIVKEYSRFTNGIITECRYRKIQIDYDDKEDNKSITVHCPYCNKHYILDIDDMNNISRWNYTSKICMKCNTKYNIIKYRDKYIANL